MFSINNKQGEIIEGYPDLAQELDKVYIMSDTVVPIISGTLGTVPIT